MANTVRTKLVQVYLGGQWRWLFCRKMPGNTPVATSNYKRAQRADEESLAYFRGHMGNHQFRAMSPNEFAKEGVTHE